MRTPLRKPILADYVYLVCLSIIWSSAFMFIKIAVTHIPPFTMTSVRLCAAGAGLFVIYLYFSKGRFPSKQQILTILPLASLSAIFGNAAPFSLIAYGETKVDSGIAAILMGLMPLMTVTLAHLSTQDEKLNIYKFSGILMGFFGLVILLGHDILSPKQDTWFYQLAIMAGACCYAINSLIMRYLSEGDKLFVAMLISVLSFIFLLPVAYLIEGNQFHAFLDAPLSAVASTLILGIIHAGLAILVMLRILKYCGASFFSQVNFIIPIFGFLWGFILLGEAFQINILVALIAISAGIFLAHKGS